MATYNMGYIGVNDSSLTIGSRFQQDAIEKDYFLQYRLQKVFSLNILDLKTNLNDESFWDFLLICLFPYYLGKALNQGLYKKYEKHRYNRPDARGRIDIIRHIKLNHPFIGNIAFEVREHSYNNHVTQLIRHTIECIVNEHKAGAIIAGKVPAYRALINQATSDYVRKDRASVVHANLQRLTHPYYTAYEPLRKICLKIIRKEGLSHGRKKDRAYGLLVDGAWLWEEYLNTVLQRLNYIHPKNKLGSKGNPIYLFTNHSGQRFPDFYHVDNRIVIDAKYKKLDSGTIPRDDFHQLISYMHVLQNKTGCFIYPAKISMANELGVLKGFGGIVKRFGFKVPENTSDFTEFVKLMEDSEHKLIAFLETFNLN
jgi:5-methylcytosine-specific restriction enzyme subunit McrC